MPSNYDSEKEVAAQSHPDPEADPADHTLNIKNGGIFGSINNLKKKRR